MDNTKTKLAKLSMEGEESKSRPFKEIFNLISTDKKKGLVILFNPHYGCSLLIGDTLGGGEQQELFLEGWSASELAKRLRLLAKLLDMQQEIFDEDN